MSSAAIAPLCVERVEGPGRRIGTRAPKELLHHLPALMLRRPSVSAGPTEMLSGARGSRMRDRRPPHYRCPAAPGLNTSARAILMALGSSVLPSGSTSFQTGTATAVLLTVAPDHCGPPGPVTSPVAVLQYPWLRDSVTAPSCELQLRVLLPGSSSLPGPVDLGYERNHNHDTTPMSTVTDIDFRVFDGEVIDIEQRHGQARTGRGRLPTWSARAAGHPDLPLAPSNCPTW